MVDENEIRAGLVLHLDPDELERAGGTYACARSYRAEGGHFFLCIESENGQGKWLPLYTKPGKGRTDLPVQGRIGHAKWTGGTFYWHSGQVWTAPNQAVVSSSVVGKDASSKGTRNTIDSAGIPKI